jgi:hypothetical protein
VFDSRKCKIFLFTVSSLALGGGHLASHPMGTAGCFLGGKATGEGGEADHSPTSTAEVKKRGAIPLFPHASIVKHMDNFTWKVMQTVKQKRARHKHTLPTNSMRWGTDKSNSTMGIAPSKAKPQPTHIPCLGSSPFIKLTLYSESLWKSTHDAR